MFESFIQQCELTGYTLVILTFGFIVGLQHATEADHVVAVTTLLSRNNKLAKASLLGAFWGLGHTLTLSLVGLAILLLAVNIPKKLGLSLEFGVGVMLLILGIAALRSVKSNKSLDNFFRMFTGRHIHPHYHGDKIHVHPHSHEHATDDGGHSHSHKSIIIGMMHGLAGSSALMLVVLSTVDSITTGLTYIAIFGIGSIVGMILISTIIGIPFVYIAKRRGKIHQHIRVTAAFTSIGFGVYIIYKIGILELFII